MFGTMYMRSMWRALNHVLDAREGYENPAFRNHLTRTYVSAICSAIRREADSDDRTSSLARLVHRLIEAPQTINRERFVQMHREAHPDEASDEAERSFRVYAPDGGDIVHQPFLESNLERLKLASETVKHYTDKFIAHRQLPSEEIELLVLRFDDIDNALNELAEVTKFLHGLRWPGNVLWQVIPVMDRSFLTMFQTPLIGEGFILPEEPELTRRSNTGF
jgi:hypothetical protein